MRCVRKVSDLRSYLRVSAMLRDPDRGILRSSPHLSRVVLLWIVSMSSNRFPLSAIFNFWEHPKIAGSYVGTVRRLAKLYNLVFHQKLLHKVRWIRWRVIVVKKPVTAWPETRPISSHVITQSFQNFNVILWIICHRRFHYSLSFALFCRRALARRK